MKKYNTYPAGKIYTSIFILLSVITFIIALISTLDLIFIIFLVLAFIFALLVVILFRAKYWNTIVFSESGINYKSMQFNWDKVYLTIKEAKPILLARATFGHNIIYHVYFSDHFLESVEINEQTKKGFYLLVTNNRLQYILPYYTKQIKVIEEHGLLKKTFPLIEQHNSK